MSNSFDERMWSDIEDIISALYSVAEKEEEQEMGGSEIKVIIMALTLMQERIERRNSKRTD